MTISIHCRACGKGYKVRDEVAGRRFKCKDCEQPIRVPAKQLVSAVTVFDAADERVAAALEREEGDGEARLPAVRRKTKKKIPSRTKGKGKRSRAKRTRMTVANGLRCVLAGILLHAVSFVSAFAPYGLLLALPLNLAATAVAIVGQAMCLAAPRQSGTRMLICGVLALQSMGFVLRLASLAIPLLFLLSSLASFVSFFLFVYALKRLAAFVGSAYGEMHAEWILGWGAGLFAIQAFGGRLVGALGEPMAWIVNIATAGVVSMMLLRYIDLLGCLKEELDGV